MTKYILLTLLISCSSDVSIMKQNDPLPEETASPEQQIETGEPSIEPSSEPSSEMTELTIGFGEIHFRQIACPACVGESSLSY